jgi:hypothetical protein
MLRHTAGFTNTEIDQTAVGLYRQTDPRAYTNTPPEFAAKLATILAGLSTGNALAVPDSVDVQATWCRNSGVLLMNIPSCYLQALGRTTTRYTILPTDADRPQLAPSTAQRRGYFTRQSEEQAYKFINLRLPGRAVSVSSRLPTIT